MGFHKRSVLSRIAPLDVEEKILIEAASLPQSATIMRTASARSRWPKQMQERVFTCEVLQAFYSDFSRPPVFIVSVTRTR